MDKMCINPKVENLNETLTNVEEAENSKRCESPVFKCVNQTKLARKSNLDSSEYVVPSYQLNQSVKSRTYCKFGSETIEKTNLPFTPNSSPNLVPLTSKFQPPSIHTLRTVVKDLNEFSQNKVSDIETQKPPGIFECLGMTNKDISWVSSMASPPPKNLPGSQFNTVEKATFLPEENFQSIQPRALFSPTLDEDFGCHPITSESDDDEEVYKSSIRLSDVCATLKKLEFKSLDPNLDCPIKKLTPENESPVVKAKKEKLENANKKRGVLVMSPENKYEFSVGTSLTKDGNFIEDDSFQSMSFTCIDELCKTLASQSSDCDKMLVKPESNLKNFYSTNACSEVHVVTSMDDLHSYVKVLEEGDKPVTEGGKIDQAHAVNGIVRFDRLGKSLSAGNNSKDSPEKRDEENPGWEKVKQYLSESQLNVSDGEIFRTLENLEKTLASQESKEVERWHCDGVQGKENALSENPNFSKPHVEDSGVIEKSDNQSESLQDVYFGAFTTASGLKISVSENALNKARKILKECEDDGSAKVQVPVTLERAIEPEEKFADLIFSTASGNQIQVSGEALKKAKALMSECDEEVRHLARPSCKKLEVEMKGFMTGSRKPIQVSVESLQKAKKLMSECEKDFRSKDKRSVGFSTGSGKIIPISLEALEKAKAFMKACDDGFDNKFVNLVKQEQSVAFPTDSGNKMSSKSLEKAKVIWPKCKSPEPSFQDFSSAGETKVRSSLLKDGRRMILWNKPDPEDRTNETHVDDSEVSSENQNKPSASNIDDSDDWDEIVPNWLHVYNTSPSIASDRVDLSPVISHEDGKAFQHNKEYVVKSPILGSRDRFYGKQKRRKLQSDETSALGRKATAKRTLDLDFSVPFKRMKFFDGVDVKTERARAREEQEKCISEKQKVKPLMGSHLNRKTSEKQIKWIDATTGASPEFHSDEELKAMGVRDDVLKISIENVACLRFEGENFFGSECRTNTKGISTGDNCLLILDDNNRFGIEEIQKAFLASPGVQPNLLPHGWVENHYKWITWKLAHYEKSFPQFFAAKALTPHHVLVQLKYRYDREIDRSERSAIKKILERDDASIKRLVLCVCGIKKVSAGYELQLTDGWYSCPARCDPAMTRLIEKRKLWVGTKLVTQGAILVNCDQGVSPLEMTGEEYLKIATNSTRRIRWDAKLGFQKNPENFPISLGSILAQGGPISRIDVIVVRIYPMLYMEKTLDGHHVTRNRKSEERADAEYRRIQEQRIETICSEVQSEVRSTHAESKSNRNRENDLSQLTGSNLSGSQDATSSSQRNENDRFSREVAEKIEKKLRQENLKKRNVSEFLRAKIVDLRKPDYNNPALLSVWNPNEDLISLLSEGKVFSLLNVVISNSARIYKPLQINTTRHTHFKEITKTVKYPVRKLTGLKEVSSKVCPAFEEVDLVGMVALVRDVSYGSRMSQVVYLTDLEMNFVGVVFWGSCKDYGWENALKISSVVACSNLQWKKTRSSQDIPSLYVNENSVFTENPRMDYLREEIQRLKEIMPKDVTSFLSKCEEDITNKLEDSRCLANASKNSSNDSAILKDVPRPGFESKPTASSTPIKPFSAGGRLSNSGEVEPSPIQKKIEKLRSYGEPPSLIPLIVRNNVKRKLKKKT